MNARQKSGRSAMMNRVPSVSTTGTPHAFASDTARSVASGIGSPAAARIKYAEITSAQASVKIAGGTLSARRSFIFPALMANVRSPSGVTSAKQRPMGPSTGWRWSRFTRLDVLDRYR